MTAERIADLRDTAVLMLSEDYKERFEAERLQLSIRLRKLKSMLRKWDAGELEFTPSCPRGIYDIQARAMQDYLAILDARAAIEGISCE